MKKTYDTFVSAVAQGRKMPTENVEKLAEGRLYTGTQALKNGLIDIVGNLTVAVDEARRMGGISGDEVLVYYEVRENSWFQNAGRETMKVLGLDNGWLPPALKIKEQIQRY